MYGKGEGVTQDFAEDIDWYRQSAEQGFAQAQYNLGYMYYKGEGVSQDYIAAHTFFDLAAAKGHKDARETRDRLAATMTADQIAEAQRRARAWKPKKWEELKGPLDRLR